MSSPEIFTEDVSAGVDYLCLLYTSCRIVHPDFCKILTETLQYFSERGVKFYKKLQHEGYLLSLIHIFYDPRVGHHLQAGAL